MHKSEVDAVEDGWKETNLMYRTDFVFNRIELLGKGIFSLRYVSKV